MQTNTEKGYCMRGDKCHYDHGPDPVVVDDSALEKMMVRSSTALSTTSSVYDVYNNALSNPPPPGLENKLIATGAAPEGKLITNKCDCRYIVFLICL